MPAWWLVAGLGAVAALTALPPLRGRRAAVTALLAAAAGAVWVGAGTAAWPGPLSGSEPGLLVGRVPALLLGGGLAALALLTALAPAHRPGDTPTVAVVAAA